MPMCRTEGVVLRAHDYSETSKIISIYSRAFGKVRVIAKGVRKPKSRFGASMEPITEVNFIFYKRENRDLYTIGQCDILQPFSEQLVSSVTLLPARKRMTTILRNSDPPTKNICKRFP